MSSENLRRAKTLLDGSQHTPPEDLQALYAKISAHALVAQAEILQALLDRPPPVVTQNNTMQQAPPPKKTAPKVADSEAPRDLGMVKR